MCYFYNCQNIQSVAVTNENGDNVTVKVIDGDAENATTTSSNRRREGREQGRTQGQRTAGLRSQSDALAEDDSPERYYHYIIYHELSRIIKICINDYI